MRLVQLLSPVLLLVLAASTPSLHAQTTCPPNATVDLPSILLSTSPAVIAANQPFTVLVTSCPAQANLYAYIDLLTPGIPPGVLFSIGQSLTVPNGLPAGTYNLTAQAQSTQGNSISGDLNITIGGGAQAAALTGAYAFLLRGQVPSGSAYSQAVMVGSFLANGAGTITSGELDLNTSQGVVQKLPFTGSYVLSPGGNTLTFHTPIGDQTFSFATTTEQAASTIQSGTFTALQPSVLYGSGTFTQQNPAPPANPGDLGIDYALRLTGETACPLNCHAAPVSTTGQIYLDQNSGTQWGANLVQTVGFTLQPQEGVSGTMTTPDTFGRAVLTTKIDGSDTGFPKTFAAYTVDANHVYLLSLDPHSQAILASGVATR